MRRGLLLILLLVLVQLTGSNGDPIWLAPAQVVSVSPTAPLERHDGRVTQVQTLSGLYGVREAPAEVVRRLKAAE